MNVVPTAIPEVRILEPRVFGDPRGFFLESCVEEVAFRMGYISAEELERLAAPLVKSGYGQYRLQVLRERTPT